MITFDLNQDAAQAIKDGKIEFAVDQQPYVQGYQSVLMLWMNITNGNDIGGGKPVLTGPSHRRHDQHRPDPALHQEQPALATPRGSRVRSRLVTAVPVTASGSPGPPPLPWSRS